MPAGSKLVLCSLLLAALAVGPAWGSATQILEVPTVASTREELLELLSACRGDEGEAESLSAGWRFSCPLCALLRSDDWQARRGIRPDLAMIEAAIRKPHGEWHGLAGLVERGLSAGRRPRAQTGLVERLDLCWLELGILLDAAAAAN